MSDKEYIAQLEKVLEEQAELIKRQKECIELYKQLTNKAIAKYDELLEVIKV